MDNKSFFDEKKENGSTIKREGEWRIMLLREDLFITSKVDKFKKRFYEKILEGFEA